MDVGMATPLPLHRAYHHLQDKGVTGAVEPGWARAPCSLQLPSDAHSSTDWVSDRRPSLPHCEARVVTKCCGVISKFRLSAAGPSCDGRSLLGHKACLGTQVLRELPSRRKLALPQTQWLFQGEGGLV